MSIKINIEICDTLDDAALLAAGNIASLVGANPNCVLGLATGSTPIPTYDKLIKLHTEEGLSFSNTCTFNLDEYWGLGGDHDQSYRQYMNARLFNHINIRPWNTHILNGKAADPHLECGAFEASIRAHGGVDVWLLGIGVNGHIAFNEPGSHVGSRTRLVPLSRESIQANSRFFDSSAQVPRQALTVGIGTILDAKKIILLATGESKSIPVSQAIEQAAISKCPASYLLDHPDCTFILDRSAASKLGQGPLP